MSNDDFVFGDQTPQDVYDKIDALIKQHRAPRSGPIWLTEMANVLRFAGLDVAEYGGWETRARSSGGYSDWPLCVMWHHTASNPSSDGSGDAAYIATGSPDAPISNLYIDRAGTVWVIAAGATNTNGKGRSIPFSRGTVPADGMNARALGVEMANNGVGEIWPQVQIDAMFTVSNILNLWFGNQPTDISTHNYYAPDRKIDPATAHAVSGPWKPRSVNSSGTWNLDDIKSECWNRIADMVPPEPHPPNPSPSEELEMGMYVLDSETMGSALLFVRDDASSRMDGIDSPEERAQWAAVLPVIALNDSRYQYWINRV